MWTPPKVGHHSSFPCDLTHKTSISLLKIEWSAQTTLVLVNWSPTKEFVPKRSLRQGDPMAPFLFLIVAEGLVGLVRQVVKKELYTG